jgi:hypothetical protein
MSYSLKMVVAAAGWANTNLVGVRNMDLDGVFHELKQNVSSDWLMAIESESSPSITGSRSSGQLSLLHAVLGPVSQAILRA